jgi:uncharacterized membrane protein
MIARPSVSVLQRGMVMDKPDPMGMDVVEKKESTDPTPFFVSLFQKFEKDHKMPIAAATMAMALALMPMNADAAMSGGRMGGSFSAPRQSMSMPRGGGGGGYSRGFSGGGGGYSRGYSRPNVIVTPGFGYNPGYYGGGYGGYGGAGVMGYSRGPSLLPLVFVGGLLFVASNVLRGAGSIASSSATDWMDSSSASSSLGSGTSVVQVSVALEVPDRDDPNSILGVLDRLARTSRTDSRVGIQNLTSQVALELLRRRSSIVSATSDFKNFGDRQKAGREFQSRAVQERAKFEQETVSKYGGVDYTASDKNGSRDTGVSGKATMAVITLVLAIDGDSTKVPRINSISDVEDALRRIASDAKVDDCLQSAEILWTPEDRSETLSLREVVADYPELRSV